jgi:hypothetical protein
VVHDGSHASLLQHDFRNPDPVRIAIVAPRQITFMQVKPAEKTLLKVSSAG